MTPNQAREILANPPQHDNWAGWMTIHRDLQTPTGSCATMREWAMQRMRDIVAKADKSLFGPVAAKPDTVAVQAPASDPGADLEVLRADFGKLYKLASKMHDFWSDDDYEWFKELGKKRGLE